MKAVTDPEGHGRLESRLRSGGPPAALAVVAVALLLRLPGLRGWWVNPDEGTYYAALTLDGFGAFWRAVEANTHPPLFFLLLRLAGAVSTELWWLRSIALVSGCAAVYVFVLVGRTMAGGGARGRVTGLCAGLLLAISPDAIVLSQVIRPYMLLVLLLACTLYSVLRYAERASARDLSVYAATSCLAILVHYSAVLGLAVTSAVALRYRLTGRIGQRDWRRFVAIQAFPLAVLTALYFWALGDLVGSTVGRHALEGWLAPYMIDRPADVWRHLVAFHAMITGDVPAVAATLLTLVGLGWAAHARAWTPFLLGAVGLLVATTVAAAGLYPFAGTRHAAWLLPFVVPVLAWALVFVLGARRRAWTLALPLAGAVAVSMGGGPTAGQEVPGHDVDEHVLRTEHVAAMGAALDPHAEPRLVVMSLETYRLLVPLYTAERQRASASPDGLIAHFRWGERDVIVLPGFDFAVAPEQMGQPNHLYTATRAAAAGFGVSLPPLGEPVLVLSGGWHVQGIFDLADLAGQLGIAGEATSVPGLIALSLDLEAYGRALVGG